jgi:hypothetical protein
VLFLDDKKILDKFIKEVEKVNSETIEDNSATFDGQLVTHYIQLRRENCDYITASMIKDILVKHGWNEDKLSVVMIGKHLKALGFKSKSKRVTDDGTSKTKKVLEVDDVVLRRLIMRYILTEDQKAVLYELLGEMPQAGLDDF